MGVEGVVGVEGVDGVEGVVGSSGVTEKPGIDLFVKRRNGRAAWHREVGIDFFQFPELLRIKNRELLSWTESSDDFLCNSIFTGRVKGDGRGKKRKQ